MKSSKFAQSLAGIKMVATGVKATNDTEPTLSLLGIPGKFQFNKLATKALNVKVGERIRIFAGTSDDINTKYFVGKTVETDTAGAKLSKANSGNPHSEGIDMIFNYAGVWSSMLQGDAAATELGNEALAAKGLVLTDETSGGKVRHRATKNVKFKLELIEVEEPIIVDEIEFPVLYALTDYSAKDKSAEEMASSVKPADTSAADADAVIEEEEEETEE